MSFGLAVRRTFAGIRGPDSGRGCCCRPRHTGYAAFGTWGPCDLFMRSMVELLHQRRRRGKLVQREVGKFMSQSLAAYRTESSCRKASQLIGRMMDVDMEGDKFVDPAHMRDVCLQLLQFPTKCSRGSGVVLSLAEPGNNRTCSKAWMQA